MEKLLSTFAWNLFFPAAHPPPPPRYLDGGRRRNFSSAFCLPQTFQQCVVANQGYNLQEWNFKASKFGGLRKDEALWKED